MSKRNLLGSVLISKYLTFRSLKNAVVNAYLENKIVGVPDVDFDEKAKLNEQSFSDLIMSYPYKWDPLNGLIDFTFIDPKFFFWRDLPFGRDCIPEFETVYVNGGLVKRMDELVEGDLILSYNFKTKKQEYKKISKIWKTGKKDLYEIKFLNGLKSYSSKDHKFFSYEKNNSKEYSPIRVEDLHKRFTKASIQTKLKKVPVLKKLHYEPIDIEWINEEICFLIGYYLAEGFKQGNNIRIGGHDIPSKIIPILDNNKIEYSLSFRNKDNLPIVCIYNNENNNKIHELLLKIKNKSNDMNIPMEISMLPEKKLLKILEGNFLGDGHSRKSGKNDTYTTASDGLKEFLVESSYKIGNPLNVYFQKDSMGAGKNPLPLWRLIDNKNSFFKKDYGYDGISETSLKKITNLGHKVDMIDIEVEDNHNFFLASSGTLVHNCDDFAYMWYLYHTKNERESHIYIVIPDYDVKKAHAICVSITDEFFIIYDYNKKYFSSTLSGVMDSYWDKMYRVEGYKSISYARLKDRKLLID